jgi:hypothetical protein
MHEPGIHNLLHLPCSKDYRQCPTRSNSKENLPCWRAFVFFELPAKKNKNLYFRLVFQKQSFDNVDNFLQAIAADNFLPLFLKTKHAKQTCVALIFTCLAHIKSRKELVLAITSPPNFFSASSYVASTAQHLPIDYAPNYVVADGHTKSNAPDLFRPPKLSGLGPGQY